MADAFRGALVAAAILVLGGSGVAQVSTPAPGMFLLSRPELPDPSFNNTVVLIVEYAPEEGAFGVIVNRPTGVPISRVFPHAGTGGRSSEQLYFGGPVSSDVLLALFASKDEVEGALRVFEDVFLSGDRDLMVGNVAAGGAVRVYAGYSGWAPGQLDAEMSRGDWIVLPAERDVVFSDVPEEEWQRLSDRLNQRVIEGGAGQPASVALTARTGIGEKAAGPR